MWNYKTYQHIHTLEGHNGFVKSVAYIYNTNYVVSGSFDKTVKIWNY